MRAFPFFALYINVISVESGVLLRLILWSHKFNRIPACAGMTITTHVGSRRPDITIIFPLLPGERLGLPASGRGEVLPV